MDRRRFFGEFTNPIKQTRVEPTNQLLRIRQIGVQNQKVVIVTSAVRVDRMLLLHTCFYMPKKSCIPFVFISLSMVLLTCKAEHRTCAALKTVY